MQVLVATSTIWLLLMTFLDTLWCSFSMISRKLFKKFAKKAQNEFDCKIKKIRSDNGK
jgi:hypothetical protein